MRRLHYTIGFNMQSLISNVTILKKSWENKLFITSDIDWASDEVLQYSVELFEKHNAKCTFFATHQTEVLNQIGDNFEVGIHPNFNFLLSGDFRYGKNYQEVIDYYHNMFPEAKSIRSHSLTQSSSILGYLVEKGFTHEVNHFISWHSKIELRPWEYWQKGMLRIPYFWEDDVHCTYKHNWSVDEVLKSNGLKVFDFHPIHIFLNTEDLSRYEAARPYLQNYKELKRFVNTSQYGTRNFLIDIIKG